MKNLNEYINEGLFDNIGVGVDAQIQQCMERLDLAPVNKIHKYASFANHKGEYVLNPDSSVDINCFACLGNQMGRIIDIPSCININKYYYNASTSVFGFEDMNVEDWNNFIPTQIVGSNKFQYINFENVNIDDNYINKYFNKFLDGFKNINIVQFRHCNEIKNIDCDLKLNIQYNLKTVNFNFLSTALQTLKINCELSHLCNLYLKIDNTQFEKFINCDFKKVNKLELELKNTKLANDLINVYLKDEKLDNFIKSKEMKPIIDMTKNCQEVFLLLSNNNRVSYKQIGKYTIRI